LDKKTGNPTTIKEKNQKVLAQYLFENKTTSRSNLVKVFKLSAPSIYKNIGQLIEQNIVLELGEGGSEGGRRPKLISFNYDYGYIVGIDLKGETLKLALANMELNIIGRAEISINEFNDETKLISQSIKKIKSLLKKNKIKEKDLLSISIGYPGSVNQKTGSVKMAPDWLNVSDVKKMEAMYSEAFSESSILIKNDTNLAATGELKYGCGQKHKNLLYINVDMGVGAGIIIDGKLFEGSRFASGEIGFTKTKVNSSQSLEDEISIRGLVQQIKNDSEKQNNSDLLTFINKDETTLNFKVCNKALKKNDPYLINLMEQIVEKLSFVLVNSCYLLDMDAFIIGGQLLELNYDFKSKLDEMVNEYRNIEVEIGYSSLNQDEVIYGGFALALDEILKNIVDY